MVISYVTSYSFLFIIYTIINTIFDNFFILLFLQFYCLNKFCCCFCYVIYDIFICLIFFWYISFWYNCIKIVDFQIYIFLYNYIFIYAYILKVCILNYWSFLWIFDVYFLCIYFDLYIFDVCICVCISFWWFINF